MAHLPHRSARYLETGSGRGLVLLHAFPLSADQWLPQLHRASRGWRVVAPDLRGFGPAGDPVGDLSIDDYADDVLAFMSHVDLERAVVCGLSMGGYVSLAMAARAPQRVSGLVLANTRATADPPEARANRDALIRAVREEGPAALASAMLPKLLGATTTREQPDLVDAVERMIRLTASDAAIAALGALRDRPDRTPLLAEIRCPVVVIAGAEDVVVPMAEAQAMHQGIAGSRLVVLPGAGHLSNLEAPAAFNAAMWDDPRLSSV